MTGEIVDDGQPGRLRGMTWDHPRAYEPLAAFDAGSKRDDVRVHWDRQSLADFEAYPLDDLARRYDFMIIDHPGLGAAVQQQALLPLDEIFGPGELVVWKARTVGRTWSSYRYAGHQWAIPIDAATQVTVYRPDRLAGVAAVPTRWQAVPELAREVRIALCLGGPHAFLGLLGMCASAGAVEGATNPTGRLLDEVAATDAIDLLRALWAVSDQETSRLDPIGVHEALAASPDLAYCPLAYGYARYAEPAGPAAAQVAWSAAPGWLGGPPGSVLGGTGLAVSSHSADRLDDLRAFVRAFLADDVQSELVPANGGQPAHLGAWGSPAVDRRWGGYYSATRSSVDSAWIRPRLPGWIAFQDHASELVRECVTGTGSPAALAAQLNRTYTQTLVEEQT